MQYALAALLALSLWAALTNGRRLDIAGVSVSLRDWHRPAVAFVTMLFASAWWRWRQGDADRVRDLVETGARVALLALLILTPALWLHYLVLACGGLDSYGYVSAASLIADGQLSVAQPTAWLPVASALEMLTPLGYVLSPDRTAIVPEFPPGLPLVMAVFRTLCGASGVFFVSPVFGTGILVLTVVLLRRVSGPLAALLGAIFVAAHPVIFAYAIQPMSDVLATFWLVLAATLILWERPHAVGAGLAAGLALWTRPPLVLAAFLLPLLPQARNASRMKYLVGLAPCLAALMAAQWVLYGHPLMSGHGSAGGLFSFGMLGHNLGAHSRWLLAVHTPLFVLALAAAWRYGNRQFLATATALFVAVAMPYLLYRVPFDDWEMIRFLLPGLVFLVMSAADGVVKLCERFLPPTVVPVAVLATALVVTTASYDFLRNRGVFQLADGESKFPRVGTWFNDHVAQDDVVMAALHSGSIRYYTGRTTVRWDQMPPGSIAEVVRAIVRRGGDAYLALDGVDEQQQFAQRFGPNPEGIRIEFVHRVRTVDIARLTLR